MKKLFSLILVLALGISLALPALAAEEPPAAKFADVPEEHSFYAAIMDCAAKGITSGYADGTFRPASQVTRAQFCVMLSRAFYPDKVKSYEDNPTFKQIGWFGPNVWALYFNDILKGTSFTDDFDSDNGAMDLPISRYDMAKLMTNIMSAKGVEAAAAQKTEAQAKITDYSSIPAQYQDGVKSVFALGIITGFSDGSFGGGKVMNRGQGCVAVYRMAQYISADQPAAAPEPEPEPEPEAPVTPAEPEIPAAGTLTNGKPITEDNVLELLKELQSQWPNQKSFAAGYSAGNNSSIRPITNQYTFKGVSGAGYSDRGARLSTTIGCGAWTALVADYLYGTTNVTWRKTTAANVRPGDLILSLNPDNTVYHAMIATSKSWHDNELQWWEWNITEAGNNKIDLSTYKVDWRGRAVELDDTMGIYGHNDIWTCYSE